MMISKTVRSRVLPAAHLVACLAVLILAGAGPAHAQSSDDVASRVGTVARQMSAEMTGPWTVDGLFAADVNRGNTDSTNVRSTLQYVRDAARWRFGSYLTGAYETSRGETTNDRAGLNLALARRLGTEWRLVLIEEVLQAPVDGIDFRNLLGGVAVWAPARSQRVEFNVYGGAGWASEDYTTGQPSANYAAALAGASATVTLSPTATLTLVEAFTQDLSDSSRFAFGTTIGLKAAVTSVVGTYLTYANSYSNEPVAGKVSTNNAISAGLTVTMKGAKK